MVLKKKMSSYPKNQRRNNDRSNDRNNPISPTSQRVYRPKNQVSPAPPDVSSSPLSPPSGRFQYSSGNHSTSWNARSDIDTLSTSAPGREPAFSSIASTSVPTSSSFTHHHNSRGNYHNQHHHYHNQQHYHQKSKPRSQSFGTNQNQTVSYMRKLTFDDIKKFCEQIQSKFWSGEISEPGEGVGDWTVDLSIKLPEKQPNKVPFVKVKKNSVRGKTFTVYEGEPEEKGSALWFALKFEVGSIRTYQEGEEHFNSVGNYMMKRMKSYLEDKGGVKTINYTVFFEQETTEVNTLPNSPLNKSLGNSSEQNSNEQKILTAIFVVSYQ